MQVLYNFGICLFSILLSIFSPFHAKARMGVLGRKNWKSKVERIPKNKKVVWFHCASLGEFDQGLPVMNSLKLKNPDLFLLVTFFLPLECFTIIKEGML